MPEGGFLLVLGSLVLSPSLTALLATGCQEESFTPTWSSEYLKVDKVEH